MWDRNMDHCVKRIAPKFNRMVIFSTTDFTFHGHPDPLTCPADVTRKSLALYYFTNGRPTDEISEAHSTLFRARPGEDFSRKIPKTTKEHAKTLAKEVLPPFITRIVGRLT